MLKANSTPLPKMMPSQAPQDNLGSVNRGFLLALAMAVIITGITGNTLVIYVFGWVRRAKRSTTEFAFLLLAVTDLLCCIVTVPIKVFNLWNVDRRRSQFARIMQTKYLPTAYPIFLLLSQGVLVAICVDRYRAVVKPFSRRFKPKILLLIYFCTFLLGLIMYLPYALVEPERNKRSVKVPHRLVRNVTLFFSHGCIDLARDIISLIIMVVLVHKSLKTLGTREESLENMNNLSHEQRNKAVRKTLTLVIVIFTILVLPFDVVFFFMGFRIAVFGQPPKSHDRVIAKLLLYLRTMQLANSCANVFIYSFVHPAFEKWRLSVYKRVAVLCRCCTRKEPKVRQQKEAPGTPMMNLVRRIAEEQVPPSPPTSRSILGYSIKEDTDNNSDAN